MVRERLCDCERGVVVVVVVGWGVEVGGGWERGVAHPFRTRLTRK